MGVCGKKKADILSGSGKAKLLDLTRSSNAAISLNAFKEFSFEELADLPPTEEYGGLAEIWFRHVVPSADNGDAQRRGGTADGLVHCSEGCLQVSCLE